MEWQDDGALRGEYTMHSFGESPSVAVVSRLSAILEDNPPQKYSLSATACQGILNRAERRGKKLPEELEQALRAQSVFQERAGKPGGGKGILIQNEMTGSISAQHSQNVMCLNDQGGSVMDVSEEQTATLRAQSHGHEPVVVSIGNGQLNQVSMAEQANTLDTMHDQQAVMVSAVDCRNLNEHQEVSGTLQCKQNGGYSLNYQNPIMVQGAYVRRLTPLEAERLQGYPDGWTDIGEWVDSKGKKHKIADTPRYKALGNSIALPFWFWLLRRISAQYIGPATLGSLFDGIGGFPLCWERCNGNGTALWASEIEEFPMAVTRRHFREEETM